MVYQCLSWCIHLYLLNSVLLTQKKLNKPSGVCPFETLTRRESISTSARWFCMASAWVKWPRCWEGLSNTSKKVSIQSDQTNVKRMSNECQAISSSISCRQPTLLHLLLLLFGPRPGLVQTPTSSNIQDVSSVPQPFFRRLRFWSFLRKWWKCLELFRPF